MFGKMKKAEQVYIYTFASIEFSNKEIETYLKGEIMPSTKGSYEYRSDYADFSINGNTITFRMDSNWVNNKKKLMAQLQTRLNMLSTVKKYKKLLK